MIKKKIGCIVAAALFFILGLIQLFMSGWVYGEAVGALQVESKWDIVKIGLKNLDWRSWGLLIFWILASALMAAKFFLGEGVPGVALAGFFALFATFYGVLILIDFVKGCSFYFGKTQEWRNVVEAGKGKMSVLLKVLISILPSLTICLSLFMLVFFSLVPTSVQLQVIPCLLVTAGSLSMIWTGVGMGVMMLVAYTMFAATGFKYAARAVAVEQNS